ncbi:hypothetical protein CDAR_413061 [Caerostris darwini]|uniref:Uncharacterized protein n=1 Tax=Caerostris darwini TaxID=1538125 RepID=A0AAV4R7Y7_9ARAC|nr:hypothetical protein CDAR_413061 [Caerostris darwini]
MTCACRDRGLSNTTGPGVVRVTTIDELSLASILKPETSNTTLLRKKRRKLLNGTKRIQCYTYIAKTASTCYAASAFYHHQLERILGLEWNDLDTPDGGIWIFPSSFPPLVGWIFWHTGLWKLLVRHSFMGFKSRFHSSKTQHGVRESADECLTGITE